MHPNDRYLAQLQRLQLLGVSLPPNLIRNLSLQQLQRKIREQEMEEHAQVLDRLRNQTASEHQHVEQTNPYRTDPYQPPTPTQSDPFATADTWMENQPDEDAADQYHIDNTRRRTPAGMYDGFGRFIYQQPDEEDHPYGPHQEEY